MGWELRVGKTKLHQREIIYEGFLFLLASYLCHDGFQFGSSALNGIFQDH